MSLNDRLSALRLPFFGPRRDVAEEQRLLKLYWNRAGLKKELASLDDQLYQLRDRLKQQQAATERATEQTESLETLLGDPQQSFGALVHYQLRALWRACFLQLEQFGTELHRQQEDRERKRQVHEFNQDRQGRVQLAAERITDAGLSLEEERAAFAALEARLRAARGLWHYFRRRRLREERTGCAARCARAQRNLEELQQALHTIEKEPWPEFGGLSVEGRRAINIAVIAYTQVLYQGLAAMGLAQRLHLAHVKSVYESNYGSRDECESLMREISTALAAVRQPKELAPQLRARTDVLRSAVSYRHPEDAVPEPVSLPSTGDASGEVSAREPNVLTDDYWNVYKVLLQ